MLLRPQLPPPRPGPGPVPTEPLRPLCPPPALSALRPRPLASHRRLQTQGLRLSTPPWLRKPRRQPPCRCPPSLTCPSLRRPSLCLPPALCALRLRPLTPRRRLYQGPRLTPAPYLSKPSSCRCPRPSLTCSSETDFNSGLNHRLHHPLHPGMRRLSRQLHASRKPSPCCRPRSLTCPGGPPRSRAVHVRRPPPCPFRPLPRPGTGHPSRQLNVFSKPRC